MNPTQILVSQTTADVLAESIALHIGSRSDVSLFCEEVVPVRQVASSLISSSAKPQAVILVGRAHELQEHASVLLNQFPKLILATIAIGGDQVKFDLRQLGLPALVASICELSRIQNGWNEDDIREIQALPRLEVTDDPSLLEAASEVSFLQKALQWLDAVLLRHLERTSHDASEYPGLTISRGTIEDLFHNRPPASGEFQKRAGEAESELRTAFETTPPGVEPLADLHRGLQLDWLEFKAFLVCLAPELDSKYQRIFGFHHDDLTRRHATLGLLASLLGEPHAPPFGLGRIDGLFRWGLIGPGYAADEPLRVDPSLVSWITGNSAALSRDPALTDLIRPDPWPGAEIVGELPEFPEFRQLLETLSIRPDVSWLVLTGPDASLWRAWLELAAQRLGLVPVRILQSGLLRSDPAASDSRLVRLSWIPRLTACIPVVDSSIVDTEPRFHETLKALIAAVAVPNRLAVLIASDIAQVIDHLPESGYRVLHWSNSRTSLPEALLAASASKAGLSLEADACARLAAAYPLNVGEICSAIKLAVAQGAGEQTSAESRIGVIADACSQVLCPILPRFATALKPTFQLDDVVLPLDRRQQLDDIVSHIRHAGTVLNDWGFGAQLPYGRGVAALFMGPSGTGKTMAAQAIGNALQRTVFAVDLSRVVNKYIGETEKNLDAVFCEAERAGAVLLFDEADALFGKRSEVKDAHDRYANIETAYLLQRMEAFEGLAILTSNFGQNLDSAFLRRLRFVVDFCRPDATAREKIWRQCLPPGPHLAENINLQFLARRVEINGGNIRQITLRAAFSAAAEGVPINLNHLLAATRAEVMKLGMPGLARELVEQAA